MYLKKIDNIMFRVKDLETSAKYYSEVLGLKEAWRDEARGMIGYIFLESDGEIVIHTNENIPNPDMSFQVDDVEAFCKAYTAKGYTVVTPPFAIRCGMFAVLADPDGNSISIVDLTSFDNKITYDEKTLFLHHSARKVAAGRLNDVIQIFEQLGCIISYKPNTRADRVLMRQPGLNMRLQFIETEDKIQAAEIKKLSHIAFVSPNPKEELERIKDFVSSLGLQYQQGAFAGEGYYWFDCPDLFVDFVVEIMDLSVLREK